MAGVGVSRVLKSLALRLWRDGKMEEEMKDEKMKGEGKR